MSQNAQEFFTIASVLTFGGAAFAVWIISNTFRALLKKDVVWIPFIGAMVIAFAGAGYTDALVNWKQWLIVFLNGCLLFCTATGINETAVNSSTSKPAGLNKQQGSSPVSWWTSWFQGP